VPEHFFDALFERLYENNDSKPLLIREITSGCGCTVVDIPKEPILSGQKTTASVKE
jgi:hypothetical protein